MATMKATVMVEFGDEGKRVFAEVLDGAGRLFDRTELAIAVPEKQEKASKKKRVQENADEEKRVQENAG